MDRPYWQRQEPDKPLFPDLLWGRPENRLHAGKLLIVGGNSFGFAAAAEAYGESIKAGVGTPRVLLPDGLYKTVSKIFPPAEYAPSTRSGSFAKQSLAELLSLASWGDATVLAGDLGRNSETAVLLESFLEKYHSQLAIVQDAVDYCMNMPLEVLDRDQTTLVVTMSQLQKLAVAARFTTAFTSQMDFLPIIETLHQFTKLHQANIVLVHEQTTYIAVNGRVSTTKTDDEQIIKIASHAAVWLMQNPSKPFEALTAGVAFFAEY